MSHWGAVKCPHKHRVFPQQKWFNKGNVKYSCTTNTHRLNNLLYYLVNDENLSQDQIQTISTIEENVMMKTWKKKKKTSSFPPLCKQSCDTSSVHGCSWTHYKPQKWGDSGRSSHLQRVVRWLGVGHHLFMFSLWISSTLLWWSWKEGVTQRPHEHWSPNQRKEPSLKPHLGHSSCMEWEEEKGEGQRSRVSRRIHDRLWITPCVLCL